MSNKSDFGLTLGTQSFYTVTQFVSAMVAKSSNDFTSLKTIMDLSSRWNGYYSDRIYDDLEPVSNELLSKIVVAGVYYKFSQNTSLTSLLLGTEDRAIVFADPYDRVLGAGMRIANRRIYNDSGWTTDSNGDIGLNILGYALETVRERLLLESQ